MPSIAGAHHVSLTVSDADRSAAWYSDLLGMPIVMSADEETVSFRVLADPQSGWVLGVRQYHGREADRFDEFRTGMDHFAFAVTDRSELEARDVSFSPIAETPIGSVIVFRDPDNIQLEFWLPAV